MLRVAFKAATNKLGINECLVRTENPDNSLNVDREKRPKHQMGFGSNLGFASTRCVDLAFHDLLGPYF